MACSQRVVHSSPGTLRNGVTRLLLWPAALLGLLLLAACGRQAPQSAALPDATAADTAAAAATATVATALVLPVSGSLITRVGTDKARYAPGEPVTITVELNNATPDAYSGQITLAFEHLGETAAETQAQAMAALAPDATAALTFTWTPPATDYQGYRVEAQALDAAGAALDTAATAVDVSSDWARFPRYGFVSYFEAGVDAADVMAKLNAFHINAIEFYDWQWQHHRPYSPDETWPDIANRQSSRATVSALIDQAHRYNMIAMSYNLAYGAYDHYWEDGSGAQVEWGLFNNGQGNYTPEQQDFLPLPAGWATSGLYLMNPGNTDWQQYIFGQMQQVFDHFAFDGWHIDTLGKRNPAWGADGQMVNMPAAFVAFTNAAKAALQKRMVFNTVGGYAQDQIAETADVDVVYSEVWETDGIETYQDIANLVERARAKTGKAMVIPAYMSKAYGQATPAGTTRFFNEHSVRLTDAAIFAAGATHLELGDNEAMLSSEYFPSQPLVMSDTLKAAMHDYYDFLVAYENLLLDQVAAADNAVALEDTPASNNGKPGTVWTLVRTTPGYTVLHLINLTGNRISLWRDDGAVYPEPPPVENLAVKIYGLDELPPDAQLWYATPDREHGKAHLLDYTTGADDGGSYIAFSIPRLAYWDMVWVEE